MAAVPPVAVPVPMPMPKRSSAPHFGGFSGDLKDFFADFNTAAAAARLNDQEKIEYLGRYARKKDKETWESLDEFQGGDYDAYVDMIESLYPTVDDTHKYTMSGLERLVSKWRGRRIRTLERYSEYDRDFRRPISWLIANALASGADWDRLFWKGIHRGLRDKLYRRLQIQLPDQDPRTPFTYEQIGAAARYVLANRRRSPSDRTGKVSSYSRRDLSDSEDEDFYASSEGDGEGDRDSSSADNGRSVTGLGKRKRNGRSNERDRQRRRVDEPQERDDSRNERIEAERREELKREKEKTPALDAKPFRELLGEINVQSERHMTQLATAITTAMNNRLPVPIQSYPVQNPVPYYAPAPSPQQQFSPPPSYQQPPTGPRNQYPRGNQQQQSPQGDGMKYSSLPEGMCVFCGQMGHFIRECMVVEEYIRNEKAKKDSYGRLVQFSGEPIRRQHGVPIKMTLDQILGRPALSGANATLQRKDTNGSAAFMVEIRPDIGPLQEGVGSDTGSGGGRDKSLVSLEELYSVMSALMLDPGVQSSMANADTGKGKARDTGPPARNTRSQSQDTDKTQSQGGDHPQGHGTLESPFHDLEFEPTQPLTVPPPQASTSRAPPPPQPRLQPARQNNQNPRAPGPLPRLPPLAPAAPTAGRIQNRSVAEKAELVDKLFDMILQGKVRDVTPAHILACSPMVRQRLMDFIRPQRLIVGHTTVSTGRASAAGLITAEDSMPLRELDCAINHVQEEKCILDDGSECVIIHEDVWHSLRNSPALPSYSTTLESADSSLSRTIGIIRDLPITFGDVTFYVQAQVVSRAPYRVLLGRPFYALASCVHSTNRDGSSTVQLTDPNPPHRMIVLPTTPRSRDYPLPVPAIESHYLASPYPSQDVRDAAELSSALKSLSLMTHDEIRQSFRICPTISSEDKFDKLVAGVYRRYKPAAQKKKPIAITLPDKFRIERKRPGDPLADLEPMPVHPPEFTPGERLTQARLDALKISQDLTEEERKLAAWVLKVNEMALAWDESEKGQFREDYFEPVKIPTVDHVPWIQKNIPIPPGMREEIINLIRSKIQSGVYEPSNSAYRSRWFIVYKKDGKKFRIVHDLQPLNEVTIRDAGVPPIIDEIVEEFAGHSCYTLMDIFVGYDHRVVAAEYRDMMTFQTPLGTFRLVVLPMGYTNAVSIFHGDVTFIFEPEIPRTVRIFIDDVALKGPKTRYILEDGTEERIEGNPDIRRFIWEHLGDVHRVLRRMRHAGGTFSALKLELAVSQIGLVGHTCTPEGRLPDRSHIKKILAWPIPRNLTELRGFLGVANFCRIYTKGFSKVAMALTRLNRKQSPFVWGEEQQQAFDALKVALTDPPALMPINYSLSTDVILAVDSCSNAMGYVLCQEDVQGQRHVARYGSVLFSDIESRYSQAKLEFLGLLKALKATRMYILGVKRLIVEVDAQYIKGMLNNPDEQPNAALNRWIAYVRLFDFELRHVPKDRHKVADGLSRRRASSEELEEREEEEDVESYLESNIESFYFSLASPASTKAYNIYYRSAFTTAERDADDDGLGDNLPSLGKVDKTNDLAAIRSYLERLEFPSTIPKERYRHLIHNASQFFILNDRLWRRNRYQRHQLVVEPNQRYKMIREAHDKLGHRGFYATRQTLLDRFWWPGMRDDIHWYLRTCHECQIRNMAKVLIPPTVPEPATLYTRCHIDTFFLPKHRGVIGIVHARDSLSGWPEWRMLREETAEALAKFIFEEILCRWGSISEIVTDNAPQYIAAVEFLCAKYHIRYIRVTAYNSKAQGIIERSHLTMRESIVKACGDRIQDWPLVAPYCFWADRVTTRKSTGHSPYYIAHGVEPVLPFDLTEATYLAPKLITPLPREDLIAIRAVQLEKREEDLEAMRQRLWDARKETSRHFAKRYENNIKDYDFQPGTLVLVRNSRAAMWKRKVLPRYLGPYVVVGRRDGGSYVLAELDGAVSDLRFTAFRVIPYHLRSALHIPDADSALDTANASGDVEMMIGDNHPE